MREVAKSHVNYVVADTKQWEQSAAYLIDTNDSVDAFVKNAGLGFAIPYFYNGEAHDYVPDFIVRLKTEPFRQPIGKLFFCDPAWTHGIADLAIRGGTARTIRRRKCSF